MYFHKKLKIHKLIGDPEEAFYQLGLIDKNYLEDHLEHLSELAKSGNKVFDVLVQKSIDLYSNYASKSLSPHIDYLRPYLDSMDINLNQFYSAMVYPELMTALAQFMPLNIIQLGCSSIFHRNRKGEMLHLRVLDFPINDTYTKSDRFLLSAFDEQDKVFSIGPKGMPLHSLTAMNESQLSLAVHQKFDKHFNPNGLPILFIAHQIITQAKTLTQAKDIARSLDSIGSWGIQMGDKDGNVLCIEYNKNGISFKEKKLENNQFAYINNQLFDTPFSDALPASINMYNHGRDEFFADIEKKAIKRKTNFGAKELLIYLQEENYKKLLLNKKDIPFFTPSSVQISCFNLNQSSVHTIAGEPPKSVFDGIISIQNVFEDSEIKINNFPKKKQKYQNISSGMRELIKAQVEFDFKNIDKTYHHLQMAIDYLEGTQLQPQAELYFNIMNVLYLKNKKSMADLYLKFEKLRPHLPDYLEQQCLLFQIRIQHILNLPTNTLLKDLKHPLLLNVWENEENFPNWALQIFLRKTCRLRIDTFEILYLHSKCGSVDI